MVAGAGGEGRAEERQAGVFARFMRRDVRRAAWFLWIRPLDAAWSRRDCATRIVAAASSEPVSMAVRADFTRVLSSDRTPWLRRRRRSLERLRLIWLLMFAMGRPS